MSLVGVTVGSAVVVTGGIATDDVLFVVGGEVTSGDVKSVTVSGEASGVGLGVACG